MTELVSPPHSHGRYTHYSNKLHDFSVIIPRCYKDVSFNSVFPRTARLLNSLPVEWFLLTFDLNCFKSAVNTHLLSNQLSYILFLYFSPFSPFSCSSMPCSGYPALHGAKPN